MNKKKLAIGSLVASILSIIPIIINPSSLTGTIIFVIVGILFAIIGIILGFICVKDAKGFSIAGIVVGVLSSIILCLALIGFVEFKKAKDCVDNGDGTATCSILGTEMEIPIEFLDEDQMKK